MYVVQTTEAAPGKYILELYVIWKWIREAMVKKNHLLLEFLIPRSMIVSLQYLYEKRVIIHE